MDFSDDYARNAPWEKVTRKVIDPITFACTASIEYRPQLEECSFETTGPPISEPRFGDVFKRTSRGIEAPVWSPPSSRTPQTKTRKTATSSKKGGGGNSLGAFFQKSSVQTKQDSDNMSVGSRSIASRSVADLSVAERSKTEEKLYRRAKSKQRSGRKLAIEEKGETIKEEETKEEAKPEPPPPPPPAPVPTPMAKAKSCLKKRSAYPTEEDEKDDDEKSLTLEDVERIEKKFQIKEGHEMFEIERITNSMYDDLFYGSEELADFRYEAFLEEAGLDVDEYM